MSALRFRPDGDTPYAIGYRMASYIKDADYISRYIAQEYGERHAPRASTVESWMARHKREAERFKTASEAPVVKYAPAEDEGAAFRVTGLVKRPTLIAH